MGDFISGVQAICILIGTAIVVIYEVGQGHNVSAILTIMMFGMWCSLLKYAEKHGKTHRNDGEQRWR